MPGFIVGPIGSPVPATNLKPFYTYTWDVSSIFEEYSRTPQDVTVYVKECTLPTFSTAREEVDGASVVYKFASMVNWEDVRLSFYDIPYGNQMLADKLREWRDRVWTPDRGIGRADTYKRQTLIRVFNMDTTLGYTWQLHGSWPQSIRDGDMSYTQSEVKVVEVVVVYDWADTSRLNSYDLGQLDDGADDDQMPERE